MLDLQGGDRVVGIGYNVVDRLSLEVANSNTLRNTFIDKLLKVLLYLVERDLVFLDSPILVHLPSLLLLVSAALPFTMISNYSLRLGCCKIRLATMPSESVTYRVLSNFRVNVL